MESCFTVVVKTINQCIPRCKVGRRSKVIGDARDNEIAAAGPRALEVRKI